MSTDTGQWVVIWFLAASGLANAVMVWRLAAWQLRHITSVLHAPQQVHVPEEKP